nr:MAG TPA_asm: hypothetical protein [Caudoviricetes sp.]
MPLSYTNCELLSRKIFTKSVDIRFQLCYYSIVLTIREHKEVLKCMLSLGKKR